MMLRMVMLTTITMASVKTDSRLSIVLTLSGASGFSVKESAMEKLVPPIIVPSSSPCMMSQPSNMLVKAVVTAMLMITFRNPRISAFGLSSRP